MPNFLQSLGFNPTALFTNLCELPTWKDNDVLSSSPTDLRWLRGSHRSLHYRGHSIARTKIWVQAGEWSEGYVKYGYTGWQWAVAAAACHISSSPVLSRLLDTVNSKMKSWKFNHIIVTLYLDGNDFIGFHSDKTGDFEDDSWFLVIKLGAPRPFAFSLDDQTFFEQVLAAGTAVWVRAKGPNAANELVKHGVPPTSCGLSGSLVFRAIKTVVPWKEHTCFFLGGRQGVIIIFLFFRSSKRRRLRPSTSKPRRSPTTW